MQGERGTGGRLGATEPLGACVGFGKASRPMRKKDKLLQEKKRKAELWSMLWRKVMCAGRRRSL